MQQLGVDVANNPGAKMLARMGYGTVGSGLGIRQQGISIPVDPVSVKGQVGLGFDTEKEEEERRARAEAREVRDREDVVRRRAERDTRRRSRSRSRSRCAGE